VTASTPDNQQPPDGEGPHPPPHDTPATTTGPTTPVPPEALIMSALGPAKGPRAGGHVSKSDFASAVYGSVVAGTVIVSAGPVPAVALAALLVVSGIVFWLAHVYAITVANVHGGWEFGAIRKGLRKEWPVAFAAIPPALAALTAALFRDVSLADGAWIALVVAIIEQQLWGYAAARRSGMSGLAMVRIITLNVVIGLVVVALKFAVGH
jgi:hypothetical protein